MAAFRNYPRLSMKRAFLNVCNECQYRAIGVLSGRGRRRGEMYGQQDGIVSDSVWHIPSERSDEPGHCRQSRIGKRNDGSSGSWMATIARRAFSSQSSSRTEKDKYAGYVLTSKQRRALRLADKEDENDNDEELSPELLEETLERLTLDFQHEDSLESASNPTPWRSLLLYPSRAKWRSTPHPLPSHLLSTQTSIIQLGGRTTKQLKRTNERIVASQTALAELRERERRSIVNTGREFRPASLTNKQLKTRDGTVKPIFYGPEQTMVNLRYRLGPNYNIAKRVLLEVRSLLAGSSNNNNNPAVTSFCPKRIIDVGVGIGSASAAALHVFGCDNVEWIHGVDPSASMRDAAQLILNSVIERGDTEPDNDNDNDTTAEDKNKELDDEDEAKTPTTMIKDVGSKGLNKTRVTLVESLSTFVAKDEAIDGSVKEATGTTTTNRTVSSGFDLALCTYTASELPHIASTLTVAAVMWEKLNHNGVLVFVEPGTPDGFNSLRAVRNMLLECCPPGTTAVDTSSSPAMNDNEQEKDGSEKVYNGKTTGDEECHVIAPCTHNGTCPMERHKKHYGRNNDSRNDDDSGEKASSDSLDVDDDNDENNVASDLHLNKAHSSDDDDDDDDEEGDETGGIGMEDDDQLNDTDKEGPWRKVRSSQTDAFDSAFCSFVQTMPGERGREGKEEKFSYLVVQKRVVGAEPTERELDMEQNPFHDVNIVDLLSESFIAGGVHTERKKKKELRSREDEERYGELVAQALEIEDRYLDSDADELGLELVRGDSNRKSWGRIIRAPIKKKGHVIMDYCSSFKKKGGGEDGRIVRHQTSRKESLRAAPGMYAAARKARWGGLWPNIDGGT